jgi:hypothetical protein
MAGVSQGKMETEGSLRKEGETERLRDWETGRREDNIDHSREGQGT